MAYCNSTDIELSLENEDLVNLTNDRDFNASTTLANDTTEGLNYIELTNSDEFPDENGRIKINDEEIDYETNSNNILSGLTRGVNFTVEANHESGDTVEEIHTVDTNVVNRAIADADSIIDSFLGTRFNNLPFDEIPNVIRYHSVCITIYNLYSRRESIPQIVEDRYNFSISFLERVLEGKISLDSSVDVSGEFKTKISINTYADDKFFTIGSPTLGTTGTLDSW